jgi:hypothetical protein
MATINSVSLGIVQSEESTKDSNLFTRPLPYSDSDDAILLDFMGTSRTITITGKFVDSKENIKTAIGNIEAIQNGRQSTVPYVGELITKNVQIQSFSWSYVQGSPNEVNYTLTLIEGRS